MKQMIALKMPKEKATVTVDAKAKEPKDKKEKKEIVPLGPKIEYHVDLTFTEPILGSAPADKEVYKNYIASKKTDMTAEMKQEELDTLPTPEDIAQLDNKGLTVFRRLMTQDKRIVVADYQVRGFLTEACRGVTGTHTGVSAIYSKIKLHVFVYPRFIPVMVGGKPVICDTKDMDKNERPLRAMTAVGPRVSLACSEQIDAGATMKFKIVVLPLGVREGITDNLILDWLDYGDHGGISQWHSAGYGRFTCKVRKVEVQVNTPRFAGKTWPAGMVLQCGGKET